MASSKSGNMSWIMSPLTHRPLSPDIVMGWASEVGVRSADTALPLCAERRFYALCRNANLMLGQLFGLVFLAWQAQAKLSITLSPVSPVYCLGRFSPLSWPGSAPVPAIEELPVLSIQKLIAVLDGAGHSPSNTRRLGSCLRFSSVASMIPTLNPSSNTYVHLAQARSLVHLTFFNTLLP